MFIYDYDVLLKVLIETSGDSGFHIHILPPVLFVYCVLCGVGV